MKMTTKPTLLSLLLLASAVAQPQQKTAAAAQHHCTVADETALREIAEQWKSGYNGSNAEKVAALYAADAYYLTQHFVTGIVHGRAAIRAYVQNGVDAKYRVDSIEIIAMDCSGDLAYTIARYESTNAGQKAFGVNVVVARRIGGRWLIVAHEAAVPDPATAIQRLNLPGAR
jgi:uncharacterized protein (TIGR02246 family)